MSQISKNLYRKLQKQYSRRINLDLKRIKKVLQKLNNPQEQVDNIINKLKDDNRISLKLTLGNCIIYKVYQSIIVLKEH